MQRTISLILDDDDVKMLEALASTAGMSRAAMAATLLRVEIRREVAKLQNDASYAR